MASLTSTVHGPRRGAAGRRLRKRPSSIEELKRRGVTLVLLWQEYRTEYPDGYSRFCDLYGEWRSSVSATMRQTHVAGEKLFVDFAGDTVPVTDPVTGDARQAHVFVAALGASNYTYAEARWRKGWPTGSACTSTRWVRSAACRRRWSATA